MLLSTIEGLNDGYVVLLDNGSEGMSILSTHQNLDLAITARDKCNYGCSMAIIKVCAIDFTEAE